MRKFVGKVTSLKNKDTAIIEVVRFRVHPIYEKRVQKNRRYPVHNTLELNLGDTVEFAESRPYSKTKRWATTRVITTSGSKKVTPSPKTAKGVKGGKKTSSK